MLGIVEHQMNRRFVLSASLLTGIEKEFVVLKTGFKMKKDNEEIANNENNVILKLDDGKIVEWQFKKIDDVYYGVMVGMKYWSPHTATLVETGEVIRVENLGENEEKARGLWDRMIRHKGKSSRLK